MSPNDRSRKAPNPFTPRSLVGMTQGARKRKVWAAYQTGISESWSYLCAAYRIGQKLRPCVGCEECRGYDDGIGVIHCDGSGVLPARRA